MPHLGGSDRRMLADLGAKAAKRVERDVVELFVCPFDGCVEDAGAGGCCARVALQMRPRTLNRPARLIRRRSCPRGEAAPTLAPGDLTDAGGSLEAATLSRPSRRSSSRQRRLVNSEIRIPPAMIAVASSTRWGPAVRRSAWTCSLVASFKLLHLGVDRVVVDRVVADGSVENLAEPRQRLVDRPVESGRSTSSARVGEP